MKIPWRQPFANPNRSMEHLHHSEQLQQLVVWRRRTQRLPLELLRQQVPHELLAYSPAAGTVKTMS